MLTCTKRYSEIPFAHRQHNHKGHCAQIHGHSWSFEFEFGCNELDENGFVVDFGQLRPLKEWLNRTFDHALVLNSDDPQLTHISESLQGSLAYITEVPNCGAEGLAKYVYEEASKKIIPILYKAKERKLHLVRVTVFEDTKNSASYSVPAK